MTTEKSNKKVNASQVRNQPTVVWETENVRNVYANVFNVAGSPEEFVLSFGMSHAWGESQNELKVQMSGRILMSPFAAKRLARLLNGVIREFESRYGTLQIERSQSDPSSTVNRQAQDVRRINDGAAKAGGESINAKGQHRT